MVHLAYSRRRLCSKHRPRRPAIRHVRLPSIERNGEDREHRIIVGLPHDKQLAQDADFALRWRSQSGGWRFTSISEGLRFWISGLRPC